LQDNGNGEVNWNLIAVGKKQRMTDLSIIIVSYRGWDKLITCLASLDRFSGDSFNSEVIVVDNNSQNSRIFDIEKQFPGFKFIFNDINGGFGYGCNVGADHAKGDYLLFLNPDTVASESETRRLLETARENPYCTIMSCRQVNSAGKESHVSGQFPDFYNLTGFLRAVFRRPNSGRDVKHIVKDEGNITYPDWVSGSVIMIKRKDFTSAGGFDEDFWMYFEDVDLCKRIRDKEGEVALAGDIVIEHNHGGSSRINIKTASITKTEVHISRHLYINKHKRGAGRIFIQVFMVINNIVSGGVIAAAGIIFFFIPKLFLRAIIFIRLISYYFTALYRLNWMSPRAVRFSQGASGRGRGNVKKVKIP
jgi:GT2 family glycosyltransferase